MGLLPFDSFDGWRDSRVYGFYNVSNTKSLPFPDPEYGRGGPIWTLCSYFNQGNRFI